MKYSNKDLSQTITQLCIAKEIANIVISPGSRNAPLTIGFTENNNFTCYSIVDERSAAFFALGLAQQLKQPVALVCSSGSALLNYYPAIAEAFYSDIPLVILSADRPDYLINIGDGQTIMQEDVFENHILESANCIEGKDYQAFNEEIINSALNKSIEFQGPVHINIPFEEPLYEVISEATIHPKNNPPKIINTSITEDLSEFLKDWNSAKKKIILVGVMQPNSIEQQFLNQLTEDESVIVLTETTSNLHHENFFPSIDQLIASLTEDDFKALQPEILLTFGGMIVSKKIKAFLRKHSPKQHWHVDTKKAFDTYFCLSHHFKTTPNQFLKDFLPKTESIKSGFQKEWLKVKEYRLEQHSKYVEQIPYSDFKVFSEIVNTI
ncbi:MAG: 2-succinyl-5-enolpyruvyl-6-hydroxy-3-cyclohexene-1-carboxylic-acid synthase, partial [Flavobacteriaceae bacterium]